MSTTIARWLGRACHSCLSASAWLFASWLYARLNGIERTTSDLLGLSITALVVAALCAPAAVLLWAIVDRKADPTS